jgi:hypothetical protein
MIMGGVSRKAGKQNERHVWGARMGVSLVLGLVFFLCAKASIGEEVRSVEKMQEFLLQCGELPEGRKFTKDMNLETLKRFTIDVAEASKIPIPGEWGAVFKSLTMLIITGLVCEADDDVQQTFFLGEEAETLGSIVSKVKEVPALTCLSLQDMNMIHLPSGIWTAEKVDTIMLIGITCCSTSIPKNFQAKHIEEFTVKEFVCGEDGLVRLLDGMSNLDRLDIKSSDVGNVMSFGEEKLSLINLRYLEMAMLKKKAVEDLIKCMDTEKLEKLKELKVTEVDLGDLELLKDMKLPKLKKLTLASTETKSLENVKEENLPCLKSLSLQGNLDLRLDENMCKSELFQKIRHLEVEVEACENMDIGNGLFNVESLTFYIKGRKIMKTECIGKSKEKLRVFLNVARISEEDIERLQILRVVTCKEMEVVINIGQIQLSKRLIMDIMGMFEECQCLETFDLEIKTKLEAPLYALEIVRRLQDRKRFQMMRSFKVRGVNVPQRTMGKLGMRCVGGDFNGVEGRWNEESGEWKMEGFSRTLQIHPVKMFEAWRSSNENERVTRRGGLRGTRGPREDDPMRECMVCRDNIGELEMKEFVVLNCGHWKCVRCAKKLCKTMNQEQLALCRNIKPVVELKCSYCRETFEYTAEEVL